jgi:hypothetical protein
MDATQSGSHPNLQRFVPGRPLCTKAFEYAETHLPLPILHHSIRVFLFAKWVAEKEPEAWPLDDDKIDLLFIASMYHDMGATHTHDGDLRFEVEGGNAGKSFALEHGIDEANAHLIWTAIAVHTSPQIAERLHPMTRLIRLGPLLDFRQATRDELGANDYAASIERDLPRLEIEKCLGDAVVAQAKQKPSKAPAASWPNNLLRSHLANPDWKGVNKDF